MITWDQWLFWAQSKLKKSTNPRRDSEIILERTINKSRTQLLAYGESKLEYNTIIKLRSLITRRAQGEPIAYLIGVKEFWSLNFKISPGVFIPRPDTECIVEQILNLLPNSHLNILDLGTGVGTIALALASERSNWNIIGLDNQKQALTLARQNKLLFNFKNVKFIYSNWFKSLHNKLFHLIVSNPPYISQYDKCLLKNDMHYEPKHALISNNLGLADLTTICQNATQFLHLNGWLFLEHGWNQGKYVRTLFKKSNYTNIQTIHDYHNHERATYGQWNPYD